MKRLFFALAVAALAFTACEDNNATPSDLVITSSSIADDNSGMVKVKAFNTYFAWEVEVGSGTFANERFSITLPAIISDDVLATWRPLRIGSSGGVRMSDDYARCFPINFYGYDADDVRIGSVYNFKSTGTYTGNLLQYWYADRNVTITGSFTLSSAGSPFRKIVYNMKLRKGWNKVLESDNYQLSTSTYTSPVPSGTRVDWIFQMNPPWAL